MKNSYQLTNYRELGLPNIEVHGAQFHYQDLYEFVGREQYMTTFQLRKNSKSYRQYGNLVMGVIFYDRKSHKVLENSLTKDEEVSESKIRIDSPSRDISKEKKYDLKYNGINVSDIESISFFHYKRETERYDTGEKKVPNVIGIEANNDGIDVDILNQNYLVSKNNSGVNLIQYEKEQLVGITLAFNNGRMDSRILNHLGFNERDINTNLNIWMNLYKVKERRNQLTEIDKKNYKETKSILLLERVTKILKELARARLSNSVNKSEEDAIKIIIESVKKFSPSILMHGKNQVYWDVDSYIHITVRHLKDYQLGNYQNKTPLPYKADDLELLIEEVLYRVEDEIRQYLLEKPTDNFTRHGKMAIYFNGDYYHLRINKEGRLTQFHTI
jgi:hypothetical protein